MKKEAGNGPFLYKTVLRADLPEMPPAYVSLDCQASLHLSSASRPHALVHDAHVFSLKSKQKSLVDKNNNFLSPGTDPINILQRKFYSTKFFKHSDCILNIFNQSKSWKKLHCVKFTL